MCSKTDNQVVDYKEKKKQITYHLPMAPTPKVLWSIISTDVGCKFNRILQSLKLKRRPEILDENNSILQFPKSEICIKATEVVRRFSPPYLFNHCLRSYQFGMLIAYYTGELDTFNHETFYLISMLHDMGLVDEGKKQFKDDNAQEQYGPDFELKGARYAKKFLEANNYDEEQTRITHEAIALHIAFGIVDYMGPEYNLIHRAAGVDAVGTHFDKISEDNMRKILIEYPRLNMKENIISSIQTIVDENPTCIFAVDKNRTKGMFKAMRDNPIDDIVKQ